jgi:hypothetical protein
VWRQPKGLPAGSFHNEYDNEQNSIPRAEDGLVVLERLSALLIGANRTWRPPQAEIFDIETELSVSIMAQLLERLRHTINLTVVRTLIGRATLSRNPPPIALARTDRPGQPMSDR